MKSMRSLFLGLLSSAVTGLIMVGAILVALAEGLVVVPAAQVPTEFIPVIENTIEPGQPTALPPTIGPSRTVPVVINITATPINLGCPKPAGWVSYTFQSGDDLAILAASRGITLPELLDKNCLISAKILVQGNLINLPPLPPTATGTVTPSITPSFTPFFTPTLSLTPILSPTHCYQPAGWIQYRVRPGDTVIEIATTHHITSEALLAANCRTSAYLYAGDILYVPDVFTHTPYFTPTNVPTLTPVPSRTRTVTPTVLPPTFTSTSTILPPTFTSTSTILPPTFTSTPTRTPEPPTVTPTGTSTATYTSTSTAEPPATNTATPTDTATPLVPPLPGG